MSASDQRLESFIQGVDNYIANSNLKPPQFRDEFAVAETFDLDTLNCLTQQECFDYAFMLYQYADNITQERAKQQNVLRWCEASLNSILSQEIDTQWVAKHEIKVARVLNENDLAKKIDQWKAIAESRLAHLESREYNVRRKADILIEKGKRK